MVKVFLKAVIMLNLYIYHFHKAIYYTWKSISKVVFDAYNFHSQNDTNTFLVIWLQGYLVSR